MNGPTPEIIAEAREAYEGGEALASIARRFGIRRQTLMGIRDRQMWVVDPNTAQHSAQPLCGPEARAARERATAEAVALASQKIVEQAQANGTIDDIAEILKQQIPLAGKLTQLVLRLVDKALAEEIAPGPKSDPAAFVGSIASAVAKAQEIARTTAGIKPGEPSSPDAADVAVTELEIRKNVVRAPLDKKIDTLKFCIVDSDGKPYNYDQEEDENK